MPETFVVHYSEVALKGKNRPEFARALRRNLARALWDDPSAAIRTLDGRYVLETGLGAGEASRRLSTVFGVAWFSRAVITQAEYHSVRLAVLGEARRSQGSFRMSVRRSDKSFPMGSMELEKALGADVQGETQRRVSLSEPDQTLHVDLVKGGALVYSEKTQGAGGLPVGTSGRVLHLFSGGIDSPAAAWLLMKRGCTPVYLHFYLAPTPAYALESKVMKLVRALSEFSGKSTLALVPFAEYQVAAAGVPADLEPSLFRRFMRVTAEVLAPGLGAAAISTGDCLSQAASQTLWNLGVFDEGCSLPILRPLLTYDKDEVVRLARSIGTYDLSIEEYRDCCAIITRHPRTRAKAAVIDRYADRLGFPSLAERSIGEGTLVTFDPQGGETKSGPLADVGPAPPSPAGRDGAKLKAG